MIEDPQGEGLTLTARLSTQSHPWLADHAVFGTILLPGTAFLELALQAAEHCGAKSITELTLQAPLILPESGAVQIQVSVKEPNQEGERGIAIHSRPQPNHEEEPTEWATHAQGILSQEETKAPKAPTEWPPPGAEPIALDGLYERLADAGLEYGPAFQGLDRAWAEGEEVYAEVSLAEAQAQEAQRFGIHPALLDAAAHPGIGRALGSAEEGEDGSDTLLLPFAWRGVSVEGEGGASSLRFRMSTDGEGGGLLAVDRPAPRSWPSSR